MAEQKRRALGKGLSALIPSGKSAEAKIPGGEGTAGAGLLVPLSQIHPNPDQPRRRFDAATLTELAGSIREQGLLQPLLVRRRTGGGYTLIAGERRWRAAKEAGLTEILIVVREASDKESLELALVENLQRDDLNPIELAQGYEALLSEHGYSQEELARRVGRGRPSVANTLRLLKLPPEVREALIEGLLTAGHAKALLSLEGPGQAAALAREIIAQGLSVRAAEELARELSGAGRSPQRKKKAARPGVDPDVAALVTRLERRLGVKIEIRHGKAGRGAITIRYANLAALQPILDKLEG